MFFFVLLSTIMFFFSLYFYRKNKKLKERNIELETEIKKLSEKRVIKHKEDTVSIENISIETNIKKKNNSSKENEKNNSIQENNVMSKEIQENQSRKKYTATTNIEYLKPRIPNPMETNIKNTQTKNQNKKIGYKLPTKKNDNYSSISTEKSFNPSEFIRKEQKKENDNNYNDNYLKNISRQLANELTPQTIELTDYEKVQEEQAVISYQELLTLKERIKNESLDDKNFIEELKELQRLLD